MTITSRKHPLKILQLDSDTKAANQVIQTLTEQDIKTEVSEIATRKQLVSHLQKNSYDLIFLADNPQDCSGTDALKAIRKQKVYTPVLVFSDILDEEMIVNYMSLGAADYILKTSLHRLVPVVKRIISNTRNAQVVDYQNFFETSPDLLCTCDREGHLIAINPSWGRLFSFTDAEMIDKPFIQFVHPEDKKSAAAQFQKLFDEKAKTADMVCRFQTATEDTRWLHWKMKFQDNGIINVIARDVTDTKSREVQISQAHSNLQKLVQLYKADIVKKTLIADQIRDSVVVTDLKGLIVSWNKGSEKVFGYTPEEAVGQHIALIYPEEDYKYIQEEATNVLLEQGSKEFELNMRRKSGEVFESRLTLEVTRDSEGKVNGMLGYAIDMGPVRDKGEPEKNEEQVSSEIAAQEAIVQEDVELQQAEQAVAIESETSEPEIQQQLNDTPVHKEAASQQSSETDIQETVVNNVEEFSPVAAEPVSTEVVEISVVSSEVSLMYLEDSLKSINVVEKILAQRPDYRLITTQEPEDCVDMAKQYAPSLILIDVDHSEADGFELLKQLRQVEKLGATPVIAVSEDASGDKIQAAKAAGFADYLAKPVEADKFLGVIDMLLHGGQTEVVNKASSI